MRKWQRQDTFYSNPTNWLFFSFKDRKPELHTSVVSLFLLQSETFGKERAKEFSVAEFPSDLFYTNQTVSNACGTVALLHAVGNNVDEFTLKDDGVLSQFYKATAQMSPQEKAKFMETYQTLAEAHKQHAQEGNATEVGKPYFT